MSKVVPNNLLVGLLPVADVLTLMKMNIRKLAASGKTSTIKEMDDLNREDPMAIAVALS